MEKALEAISRTIDELDALWHVLDDEARESKDMGLARRAGFDRAQADALTECIDGMQRVLGAYDGRCAELESAYLMRCRG